MDFILTARAEVAEKRSDLLDPTVPLRQDNSTNKPAEDFMQESSWRTSNIGRFMNEAIGLFERRVIELMREKGFHDLGAAHINLTRHLDERGNRLTELADRAAMTKQSMRELVEQVERAGLVERRPDPTDGRAKIIAFTQTGHVWLAAFGDSVTAAEQEMADVLGSDTLNEIRQALAGYVSASKSHKDLGTRVAGG